MRRLMPHRSAWRQRLPDWRSTRDSAAVVTLVIGIAVAIAAAWGATSSWRLVSMLVAAGLMPVVALASGNPRIFCLWCLMFALPFELSFYFGPISDKGGGERALRLELSDVFFLSLLAFQLRDVFSGRWPGLRIPKVILVWLAIMVLWGGETALNGNFKTTAVHEMVRMLKMAILFVVIVNELDTPRRMLHAAAAVTFGALFQASFGLLQYWNGRTFGLDVLGEVSEYISSILSTTAVRDSKVFRISAFVGHPNLLGIYLAACLPLAIGGMMLNRGPAWRFCFALATAVGGVALVLTQSRSSWAGFAAALVLLLALMLMHRRMFRRSMSAVAFSIVALAIVFGTFQEPIMKRLFESVEGSTTGREEFKEDAGRLIDDYVWFGVGLSQYVHELPPYMKYSLRAYSYWVPPVHNIYLLWWAETGLVGLSIHLAMWAAIVLMAWRNLRVDDETLFLMNLACMAAMIAFAVDGFQSFTLRVNPLLRVYWVLAGIIYASHYWRLEQKHAPWPARTGVA